MEINNLLNPKIWLILTAAIHTFVGMPSTYDPSNDNETMFLGIMLVIPVYMLYAAFMTEGQAQARLAAVFAGPIVVWFLVCAAMGLEVTYATENINWELSPELIPPLLFWGMTALSGVMGWNMDETAPAAEA
jgi:K+ transporter